MRSDSLGLFWRDEPKKPKEKKEKVKRTPPEPVWLADDYYPHLEDALSRQYDQLSDMELVQYAQRGVLLEFDIELYRNYLLIGFRTFDERRAYITFEEVEENGQVLETFSREKLKWVVNNFTTVGFNNKEYDNTIVLFALAGYDLARMKELSNVMIGEQVPYWQVLKTCKLNAKKMGVKFNTIDLLPVAPRSGSLKKYAARAGIPHIQDLPFHHDTYLDFNKRAILKWYWGNDIDSNELLHSRLLEQIDLRIKIGAKYGIDVRARSDAQIAEDIFVAEAKRLTGQEFLPKPNRDNYRGTSFRYYAPHYLKFNSATMQAVKKIVDEAIFRIDFDCQISCEAVLGLTFNIGDTPYKMGIGGLHSQEKSRYFVSGNGYTLKDHDVTSYYPTLILSLGMFPEAIGRIFLQIYQQVKDDRVHAKRIGDKVTNESLKIVINGSFGKFGDAYSMLFAPHLLIQTTVTGQLCILMLIERLELAGIKVVSANTDGLVTYSHDSQNELMESILNQWQKDTALELEHVIYKGLFSRDVNSYFAVKEDGKVKGKGAYALSSLELDPKFEICAQAVIEWAAKGTPIEKTVYECRDISKFVMVKFSAGGAVQDGKYLGKVVRYYKSTEIKSEIVIAKSGNKLPMSDNCREAQTLPKEFPSDIDYEWYIDTAYKMINGFGYAIENPKAA